ncbi:hypothetical protein [Streptomyces macrosporus]|uniref:Uncharacterized protein n=1 Tax=Streptomyces macrosporus TaxID=44032 RepID=A0ABN3JG70_9ACTN
MKLRNDHKRSSKRRILASTVATAAALGIGLTGPAGTAGAVSPSQAPTGVSTSPGTNGGVSVEPLAWSFYRAYWTKSACLSEGKNGKSKGWWKDYSCKYEQGNDGHMKWFLYVYNRRV